MEGLLLRLREGGQGPLLVLPSSPAFSDTEYFKGVRGTRVAMKVNRSFLPVGTQIFDLAVLPEAFSLDPGGPTSGSDFLSSEFRARSLPPEAALGPAGSSYFRQDSLVAGTWKLALKPLPPSPLSWLVQARSPGCGGGCWVCLGALSLASSGVCGGPGGEENRPGLADPGPPAASASGRRPRRAHPGLGRGPVSPPRTPPLGPALRGVIVFSPAVL